jgi:hypothetical protein
MFLSFIWLVIIVSYDMHPTNNYIPVQKIFFLQQTCGTLVNIYDFFAVFK